MNTLQQVYRKSNTLQKMCEEGNTLQQVYEEGNTQQTTELVGMEIMVSDGLDGAEVIVEGKYPLQINNHSIVVAVRGDNRRFRCATCGDTIDVSQSVWEMARTSHRQEALQYVIGEFIQNECGSPEKFNDIIQGVTTSYVGMGLSSSQVKYIEEDLRSAMTSHE